MVEEEASDQLVQLVRDQRVHNVVTFDADPKPEGGEGRRAGPLCIWPDVGGGVRISGATVRSLGGVALCFKISEGRGYLDPARQYNHDQAESNGLLPIAYTFPLPDSCGMSVEDQARRDADLVHNLHGSFDGIGVMVDVETQPAMGNWGPWYFGSNAELWRYYRAWRARTDGRIPLGWYGAPWYQYDTKRGAPYPPGWVINASYIFGADHPRNILAQVTYGHYGPRHDWAGRSADCRQYTCQGLVNGRETDWSVCFASAEAHRAMVLGTAPPQEDLSIVDDATRQYLDQRFGAVDKTVADLHVDVAEVRNHTGPILVHAKGGPYHVLDGQGRARRIYSPETLRVLGNFAPRYAELPPEEFDRLPKGGPVDWPEFKEILTKLDEVLVAVQALIPPEGPVAPTP